MANEHNLGTMQHQVVIAYMLAKRLHQDNYELRDVHGPLRMAELGVAEAPTSRYLLELFPQLEMVLVDPHSYPGLVNVVNSFKPRVQFIRKTAHAAAADVPDNSIDLVFIDARHTFENVSEDIRDWAPKLKDNGILGGHDLYDRVFPGVRKAVEATGLAYEACPGHTWWFTQCLKGHI